MTSLNNGTTFTYDLNGNMATKAVSGTTTAYEYDGENRLNKVRRNGSVVAEYGYDGDGGRVKKTAGTSTTVFVGSLFDKKDGKNTEHLYLGSERLASVVDGELVYYFTDHLGGTNVVADYAGAQVELDEYLPYGEFSRRVRTSEKVTNYFTGQKLDDESGLYYYGARYYDPAIGRFIQPDTIVQSPYDPQTLNRYSYCGNNPVNRIDPDGHSFKKLFKKVFSKFGVGTPLIGTLLTPLFPLINGFNLLVGSSIYTENWQPMKQVAIFSASTFVGMGVTSFATGGFSSLGIGNTMSSILGSTVGGAAGSASSAALSGDDIGEAAWQGAAIAGTLAIMSETASGMRKRMVQQSKLDPLGRNRSGKSGGFKGDKFKLGGNRYSPGADPSPLGGHQGGQGRIGFKNFGFTYEPDSFWDRLVEAYAGPHDFLNSWAYDSATGNIRNLSTTEKIIGGFTNPLNVIIATPIVVPSTVPAVMYPGPGIVYGLPKTDKKE